MKNFDTIYRTIKKSPAPPGCNKVKPKNSWVFFYKALQVVLSFWMVTVAAIITQPWLDYWVKSSIKQNNKQTLGENSVTVPEVKSSANVNEKPFFLLKNAEVAISAPIVEGIDKEALKTGIGHHPDSVWPNQKGNVVLAGHNVDLDAENEYGKVFVSLRLVNIGDEVIITDRGKKYIYQVFKKETVSPEDTSLFGKSDDWLLTFYTCDPPYTDWKRLVLQAKLARIE